MKRDGVIRILEENREAVRRFGVKTLGLFGSCARGEDTKASDLDFVVEFKAGTFDQYMNLKDFLEELFNCRVDLVLESAIKPRLRPTIMNEVIHATGL